MERGESVVPTAFRAEQRRAGDGCQRPLVPRSRCPPRLTPSVRPLATKEACYEHTIFRPGPVQGRTAPTVGYRRPWLEEVVAHARTGHAARQRPPGGVGGD